MALRKRGNILNLLQKEGGVPRKGGGGGVPTKKGGGSKPGGNYGLVLLWAIRLFTFQ